MIGWEKKPLRQVMPDGKIRGLGTAMAMQGSAISNCDVGSVTIKLSDEGFYNVIVGCTDMGTGCDTIIAQFVADSLDTDIDNIAVFGVDTDTSPYDSGSYASSTTYLTGMAAVKAAEQMREKLLQLAAKILEEDITKLEFDGKRVFCEETGKKYRCLILQLHPWSTMRSHWKLPTVTVPRFRRHRLWLPVQKWKSIRKPEPSNFWITRHVWTVERL